MVSRCREIVEDRDVSVPAVDRANEHEEQNATRVLLCCSSPTFRKPEGLPERTSREAEEHHREEQISEPRFTRGELVEFRVELTDRCDHVAEEEVDRADGARKECEPDPSHRSHEPSAVEHQPPRRVCRCNGKLVLHPFGEHDCRIERAQHPFGLVRFVPRDNGRDRDCHDDQDHDDRVCADERPDHLRLFLDELPVCDRFYVQEGAEVIRCFVKHPADPYAARHEQTHADDEWSDEIHTTIVIVRNPIAIVLRHLSPHVCCLLKGVDSPYSARPRPFLKKGNWA